jgi:hypothetical protein
VVNARFSAGETAYRGPVTVRVQASRAGVIVIDSITVQIVSP